MVSFDNLFFSVKSCSLNVIEFIFIASEMKDVNRRTDRHVWVHFSRGIFLTYIRNVICDTPVQKLFVIGCTARGSRAVAWCMVTEHCRRGYVAELSSEWATDTRSILDAMLYPKVSKPLRNVGKYSPNETASHRSGL